MFACIHSRSVSGDSPSSSALVDLAFTFSPLVEQTSVDTVVFDVAGQDLLFGRVANTHGDGDLWSRLAKAIAQRARQVKVKTSVSIVANADAAIHAARLLSEMTIINAGDELRHLGPLSIKQLDCSLAAVEQSKAQEIYETFALWGVRTFRDLAELPLAGVAERLGQEGVRLQKLAQGRTERALNLVRPPIGFAQSLELEHPISELEPLSFILSRLLNQLCANLNEHALATNELRLRLGTERCSEYRLQSVISGDNKSPTEVGTLNASCPERTITLPVPMRNPKTLLRLLLFDIERDPPQAPIVAITISAEPVKPRAAQTGLFIPLAPEPEKLEITLARLAKLVGVENVGSPQLLDTHRPDAFRVNKFRVMQRNQKNTKKNSRFALNAGGMSTSAGLPGWGPRERALPVMGFRICRPAWHAEVQTLEGQPARIDACAKSSRKLNGKIICAAGPWRGSGDWWRADVWARDEWDVVLIDATAGGEVLCRIYRDLTNEKWFVAGIYD
jgi:protein ImuB